MDKNTSIEYGDLYLRFDDEVSAKDILADYEGSIDTIGELEGVAGWHVNTRGPVTLTLQAFAVNVSTPYRVWA